MTAHTQEYVSYRVVVVDVVCTNDPTIHLSQRWSFMNLTLGSISMAYCRS